MSIHKFPVTCSLSHISMKKITLNHITKVEGHAEVDISIKNGKVVHCHVHSVEGVRHFESIIKGRKYDEVSLITSRICGICSCGHTICSIKAIENAFGMEPSLQTKLLRELITIGERIRSHASHIYFFALPDYLGYGSAIAMAKEYQQEIKDCLEIVRVGNELIKLVGGRDMHPFVSTVGGMTKVQPKEKYDKVLFELKKIIPMVENTIELFAKLPYPRYQNNDSVFISLDNDVSFSLHTGDIISNTGLRFPQEKYKEFLKEHFHVKSTAKFATIKGKEFMTGALARINNSFDRMSDRTRALILKYDIQLPSSNLFLNNVAQALEILHWLERAIDIIEHKIFIPEKLEQPKLSGKKLYHGIAAIEVPRGILFHDYKFDVNGILKKANIITPTVQNLAEMEFSVRTYLNQILEIEPDKTKEELQLEIEKMIRAFDPCFSCSTHFLKVNWKNV